MRVTVRFFAQLRDEAGRPSLELVVEEGATVLDVLKRVAEMFPKVKRMVFEPDGRSLKKTYQVLVSGENVGGVDRRLRDGDVVAIIPPVAGG